MTELERALVELGAELAYPPTPNLVPAVRARIPERPARAWRRPVAIALAVLAVAVGAVLAVPQARTAVLKWLGLEGVTIQRVPRLPNVRAVGPDLGERVTLVKARKSVPYRVLVPAELPERADVYLHSPPPPGGEVSLVFRSREGRVLILSQFRGQAVPFIQKSVGPGTRIEPVTVVGARGVWLAGRPHTLVYLDSHGTMRQDTLRLAGNTLLWERGGLLLRLEGLLTKEEALRIARSVR